MREKLAGSVLTVAIAGAAVSAVMSVSMTEASAQAQAASATDGLATHGLEFEHLEPAQQLALKSFVFDRIDDISHWSNGTK